MFVRLLHPIFGLLLVAAITTVIPNRSVAGSHPDTRGNPNKTFYVDSFKGQDRNTGKSPTEAWKTLDKVNGFAFSAGDSILFRRGGIWAGQLHVRSSGTSLNPIKFGTYGAGTRPTLRGARHGIVADGASHVFIEDLRITNTAGAAIRVKDATDWTLRGLRIEHTGNGKNGGGLQWWNGTRLTVVESEFRDVIGDGLWIWESTNIRIYANTIYTVTGRSADNIHMFRPNDFEIRRNYLTMNGKTDSNKGNFHSQEGRDGIIAENIFVAGNYGVGIADDDVLVRDNCFIGHAGETWSAAFIVSVAHDVTNNRFIDNVIINPYMGIYILALGHSDHKRENFSFRNNLIHNPSRNAITIESPISGAFENNIIWAPQATASPIELSSRVIDSQNWEVRNNTIRTGPLFHDLPDSNESSDFVGLASYCRGISDALRHSFRDRRAR